MIVLRFLVNFLFFHMTLIFGQISWWLVNNSEGIRSELDNPATSTVMMIGLTAALAYGWWITWKPLWVWIKEKFGERED